MREKESKKVKESDGHFIEKQNRLKVFLLWNVYGRH